MNESDLKSAASRIRKRWGMQANNGEFDGIKYTTNRISRPTVAQDSRQSMTPYARTRALSLGRWAYSNVGYVKGAIDAMARYSFGSVGLIPQAQTSDESWNTASESYFREACKIIDVTGRFTLSEMQRILSKAIDRDGDVGLVLTESSNGFPQIQMIEGHRISSTGAKEEEKFFDGVKVNASGRPIAYRVSLDSKTFQVIPATNFIHLYDADRCDQLRGITALIHALNDIQDLQEIIGFEKMGVKASLAPGLVHYTSGGEDKLMPTTVSNGITYESLVGGMIPRLYEGEKLESFKSNRPTAGIEDFSKILIRNVALGMGLPVEFVYDPSSVGGAGVRLVVAQAQRRFEERQELFKTRLMGRIWGYTISKGIKRGELPKSSEWWKVAWQNPTKITVDAGRDATANRDDVRAGLRTYAEDFGERGMDWREQIEQAAREAAWIKEMAAKYDVEPDRIAAISPNPKTETQPKPEEKK